jgi:hypothetical protein
MLEALEAAQQEPTTMTPSPFASLEMSEAERVRLSAEVVRIFRRSERRVITLRAELGYLTAADEFQRKLMANFEETGAALNALMPQTDCPATGTAIQPDGPGNTAIKLGAWAGAGLAIGGVLPVMGAVSGLVGPTIVTAAKVARRKQRLRKACDAATAALKDTRHHERREWLSSTGRSS